MDLPADYLQDHAFKTLFTDHLGWEHATGTVPVSVLGRSFAFVSVAQKRGLQVLCCSTDRHVLANRGLLRRVQLFVARSFHEHILIFSCEQPRKQVWQWAIRLPDGRKVRHREHPFFSASPPAPFLERLVRLRFTLDEEEGITLVDALDRVRQALDTAADLNLFAKRPWLADRSAELFEAMRQGGVEETHRFLVFHLRLVKKMSKPFCRWFRLSPKDARQIGFLGLMKAARRFRPELGCQFSTYATYWINQTCRRFGPDCAFPIHLPDHVFWPCFRLRLDLERMALKVGAAGVREYLTTWDCQDPKAARQFRDFERATTVRSLSDRQEPDYQAARHIAESWPGPSDDMLQAERAEMVRAALDRLHPRQAHFLRLRYGFDGCPAQTLKEIGDLYGLSRERVRQVQSNAEENLRRLLRRFHLDQEPNSQLDEPDADRVRVEAGPDADFASPADESPELKVESLNMQVKLP